MAHRRATAAGTASVIRPDFRSGRRKPAHHRRTLGPSLARLPFVTMKGRSLAQGQRRQAQPHSAAGRYGFIYELSRRFSVAGSGIEPAS
jgi:hypothetical protein